MGAMEEILGYVVKTMLGAVLTYLWTELRQYKKNQEKQEREREQETLQMKRALQCLARDRLIQAHEFYIKQGWIPIHAMSSLTALYESYESLGPNGVIDGIMDQLKSLPYHVAQSKD